MPRYNPFLRVMPDPKPDGETPPVQSSIANLKSKLPHCHPVGTRVTFDSPWGVKHGVIVEHQENRYAFNYVIIYNDASWELHNPYAVQLIGKNSMHFEDSQAGQGEIDALIRDRDLRIKREEDERQHVVAVRQQLRNELPAKHPHLLQSSNDERNYVTAAKNIRIELARHWPHVKFSVRSKSFSMGNSIDVGWDFGPTAKEVDAVIEPFEYGTFDGMTDSSGTKNELFTGVFGGTKFLHSHRRYGPDYKTEGEFFQRVEEALCQLQKVAYTGPTTRNLLGENDCGRSVDQHARELLSLTSFGPGESYAGVESKPWKSRHEDTDTDGHRHWCRVVKTKAANHHSPDTGVTPLNAGAGGITVTYNEAKQGIELRFAEKPDDGVLARLKTHGQRWRWSRANKCWYRKDSPAARAFAQALLKEYGQDQAQRGGGSGQMPEDSEQKSEDSGQGVGPMPDVDLPTPLPTNPIRPSWMRFRAS